MKKIVIVEDDPDMSAFLAMTLEKDFEVKTAADGIEGLETVKRERPDLVVLDLLMPRMHGFEVCQRIRDDAAIKETKILISSSKSYTHDQLTAESNGADDYIVKPYTGVDLILKVNEMLNKPSARDAAASRKNGGEETQSPDAAKTIPAPAPKRPSSSRVPLKIRFWGTRGSLPAPGPSTRKYGGNTPCVEFRVGEELIIIDSGTGIRDLGRSLLAEYKDRPINGNLFIGHFHWDHIQGFPFFAPLFFPKNTFNIYGMHGSNKSLLEIMTAQMAPPFFPISFKELSAKLIVHELSDPVTIGDATISHHYLNHPGITVGFRIQTKDWAVCYISDHEPYAKLNQKGDFSDKEDAAVAKFVEGCDLLISEAQYSEEEYKIKKSWGHSTFEDVLDLAIKAKVKRLALFHHDPAHTDEMMDRFISKCQAYLDSRGQTLECFGSQEGMTVTL